MTFVGATNKSRQINRICNPANNGTLIHYTIHHARHTNNIGHCVQVMLEGRIEWESRPCTRCVGATKGRRVRVLKIY